MNPIVGGDFLFVDTNILLEATDTTRKHHIAARKVFEVSPGMALRPAISGQVIREYLVVATRPVENNGLGMSHQDALANAGVFLGRCIFFEESKGVLDALMGLIGGHELKGKRLHDANIVATMLAHGISKLVTLNKTDFDGFTEIECLNPAELFD